MADEVAVFIDFENLRYGLLNRYGIEPTFHEIVEKAKKYGRPSLMRAYADFSEHPADMNRQLQVCGIEAINVPVKRTTIQRGGTQVERIKNAADMALALDMLVEAVDSDVQQKAKTFLLVAGDRDYVRLVAQVTNRFGQRVVIAGVPGSVAVDLVQAAGGEADPIEIPEIERVDMVDLKKAIVTMVKLGPAPLRYWSLKLIDSWCQDGRQGIPGTAKERRDAISELKAEGVLGQRLMEDERAGRTVTEAFLDEAKAKAEGYLLGE